MGCGASSLPSSGITDLNELLNYIAQERKIYDLHLSKQGARRESAPEFKVENKKSVVIHNNENILEIFIEGINSIERNLKNGSNFSNIEQISMLVEAYFQLSSTEDSKQIFDLLRIIERTLDNNKITIETKINANPVPDNQFPNAKIN